MPKNPAIQPLDVSGFPPFPLVQADNRPETPHVISYVDGQRSLSVVYDKTPQPTQTEPSVTSAYNHPLAVALSIFFVCLGAATVVSAIGVLLQSGQGVEHVQ